MVTTIVVVVMVITTAAFIVAMAESVAAPTASILASASTREPL